MWIVVGMLYTFIQPGVMQLHLVKEYETPQQCWMEAKAIMGDSISLTIWRVYLNLNL